MRRLAGDGWRERERVSLSYGGPKNAWGEGKGAGGRGLDGEQKESDVPMADGMEVAGDTYLYLTGFLGSRQQGREKHKSEGEKEKERETGGQWVTSRAGLPPAGGTRQGGSGWPGPASPGPRTGAGRGQGTARGRRRAAGGGTEQGRRDSAAGGRSGFSCWVTSSCVHAKGCQSWSKGLQELCKKGSESHKNGLSVTEKGPKSREKGLQEPGWPRPLQSSAWRRDKEGRGAGRAHGCCPAASSSPRSPDPPSTHSSTLFTPPGIKAHGSESSPQPRGRTGDSPITRSPLLILITPLRPFLSNKTLTQALRGTGSLLLAGRRAEKRWVRALPGWAQPLGPVLAT